MDNDNVPVRDPDQERKDALHKLNTELGGRGLSEENKPEIIGECRCGGNIVVFSGNRVAGYESQLMVGGDRGRRTTTKFKKWSECHCEGCGIVYHEKTIRDA